MAIEFTKAQQNAIKTPSGALVSAAAGSGKTAVLVERVIKKITGENPISADKLLIVTFTNSAAKEMRVRIEERLNEECRKAPDNRELLKQKIKIKNAKICTIDSFCIELVRENFDRLDISPDFNIGEQNTLAQISEQALNAVLNEAFENADDDFSLLLDAVTSDYDEGELKKFICEIYKFSENMPFPSAWLEEKLKFNANFDELADTVYSLLQSTVESSVKGLLKCVDALEVLPKVEQKYAPVLKKAACDLELLGDLAKCGEWDRLCLLLPNFKFDKLNTPRGFADNSLVVSVRSVKDSVKEQIDSYQSIFSRNYTDSVKDYNTVNRCAKKLFKITLEYAKKYFELRKEKNLLTFSDTEHLALSLLCEYKDGGIVKRDGADEIIGRYEEVLVDEFQDTNNMQNILFEVLSDNEKKLFAVGDIKQSIFGFRGANPQNFNEKKNRYIPFEAAQGEDLRKIILDSNFRSNANICAAINFIFDIIMNSPKGEVKYDENESLKPLAEFPNDDSVATELHLVNAARSDALADEAKSIAAFIKDFMENGKLYDKHKKDFRKPTYKDFTILLRQQKGRADLLASELEKYGIPVSYSLGSFLDATEIQIFMSILSVIENPTRDIELLSTLMSPVFCFSAEEIARICISKGKNSLLSAVTSAANGGDKKCGDFLDKLKKWRSYSASLSISELIGEVLEDSNVLNIVSVLSEGAKRKSNLQQLHGIAVAYDTNGFSRNISAFIKYLETISSDLRAAGNSADEESISICTIHYSKGLQFPVCILADTAQNFKTPSGKNRLLLDEKFGAAFTFNDYEENNTRSQISREILVKSQTEKQIEEELRLLYVALTRAEQKLVISVADKDVSKYIKNYAAFISSSTNSEEYRNLMFGAKNYAELICSALSVHSSLLEIRKTMGIDGYFVNCKEKISVKYIEASNIQLEEKEQVEQETQINETLVASLCENFAYKYPYEALKDIESKASVSLVAHKSEEKDYSFTSRPAFLSKGGLTPAQRGTSTHRFMQYCDFEKAKDDVSAEIERLYRAEYLTISEKEAIDTTAVEKFFQSDLYNRIKNAESIKREMRFLTEMPAGVLNSDLPKELYDEKVVVQGQVDCAFVENGKVIVLDFKTDRAKDEETLISAYSEQLEIYASACEKIFEKPINEKLIYSFSLSKTVKI